MTHPINPVTDAFLARILVCKRADDVAVGDLIELARMVRNGDLQHVDAIPAWLEAQKAAQLRDDFVDACRTADGHLEGVPV